MLPDDDMLKAFVADTMMKEEEQASSPPPTFNARASERSRDAESPRATQVNPSSRLSVAQPVLGSVLKWGLLILAVLFIWFVLSK